MSALNVVRRRPIRFVEGAIAPEVPGEQETTKTDDVGQPWSGPVIRRRLECTSTSTDSPPNADPELSVGQHAYP